MTRKNKKTGLWLWSSPNDNIYYYQCDKRGVSQNFKSKKEAESARINNKLNFEKL